MNKEEVGKLVEKFSREESQVRRSDYKETWVRREFIDPLFSALGWDISDSRVVKHEDVTTVRETDGNRTKKHPDYGFYLNGTLRFYVEAKKPAVNLLASPEYAYQVRRYGWSANLPACVLTDFEELLIYDCRIRPDYNDAATVARKKVYRFTEYLEKWDEIVALLSPEGVANNSLLALVGDSRGSISVDNAFLQEIEAWREVLAKDIAKRNPNLGTRALNTVVQNTIDRIVFLRICEDREIETYGRLAAAAKSGLVYESLKRQFVEAQDKYNSGLFDFRPESDETGDHHSLNVEIGDESLQRILNSIYYPESPYEFSVLPTDLLGQVYERFLGKIIEISSGSAQIVEKPEVRKAGGVYYTPTYIVKYIVEQTVGYLVKDKTPEEVSHLRILDPACGSGSFLLGAYDFLLNWHRQYYATHRPNKHKNEVRKTAENNWVLTTDEKRRILLNNIYGVDLDPQAVEVSKLSLLLKMLEGETALTAQMRLFRTSDKLLPDLGTNIKWGNSLVDNDFYEGKQLGLFDDEDLLRVKAFGWRSKNGFEVILREGGFDAVIGNPPYIPIEAMTDEARRYYQRRYPVITRKFDSSIIFILAGLDLLKPTGLLGYISSLTWQTGANFERLRERILVEGGIKSIVNLPFDVFSDAYVDTGIYVLAKKPTSSYRFYAFPKRETSPNLDAVQYTEVPTEMISAPTFRIVLNPNAQRIYDHCSTLEDTANLGSLTISTQGLAPNRFNFSDHQPSDAWLPFFADGQIHRYIYHKKTVAYADMNEHPSLVRYYESGPKLLVRRIVNRQDRLMATFVDEAMVFKKDANPFIVTAEGISPIYLLAILNSRLMSYLYVNTSAIATKDDFRQTTLKELRQLPIRLPGGKLSVQTELVELATLMLDYGAQMQHATAEHRRVLDSLMAKTDREIDKLVYRLYQLSDEDVQLVGE